MRTIIRDNYTPELGQYHERIIIDPVKEKTWLFDCDGVFLDITKVFVANEYGDNKEYAISQDFFTKEVQQMAEDLSEEEAARIAADEDLQDQIDTIKAASDVVDIVGTYAELLAYDTSTLTDSDIIKVLADENHENATTYYRWMAATSSWSYIGEQGPYYTQTEVDNLLDEKQDTLTAGTGIAIDENNVISSTLVIDNALSWDSTNPVENQVIRNAIYDKNSSDDKEKGIDIAFTNPTFTPYVHVGSKTSAAKGTTSVGIGYNAEASAVRSIAIGSSATASKREGVALGANANAGQYSLSIGYYSDTVPDYSTAVGPYAKVKSGATHATAIGYQSEATEAETVSVGNSTTQRRIVNVADGTTATDAATVGQLTSAVAASNTFITGETVPGLKVYTASVANEVYANAYYDDGLVTQKGATHGPRGDIYIPGNSTAAEANGIFIGSGQYPKSTASVPSWQTEGIVAIGNNTDARGKYRQLVPGGSTVERIWYPYRTVIGDCAGRDSIGTSSYGGATFIGAYAHSELPESAGMSADWSVALGFNSVATRTNEVSFGSGSADPNKVYTTRYLANVTAGTLDTDAVNVGQLNAAIASITPNNISSADWSALWQ